MIENRLGGIDRRQTLFKITNSKKLGRVMNNSPNRSDTENLTAFLGDGFQSVVIWGNK